MYYWAKTAVETAHWATRRIHSSYFGLFSFTASSEYNFVRTVSMASFYFGLIWFGGVHSTCSWLFSLLDSLFCGSFLLLAIFFWDEYVSWHFFLLVLEIFRLYFSFSSICLTSEFSLKFRMIVLNLGFLFCFSILGSFIV